MVSIWNWTTWLDNFDLVDGEMMATVHINTKQQNKTIEEVCAFEEVSNRTNSTINHAFLLGGIGSRLSFYPRTSALSRLASLLHIPDLMKREFSAKGHPTVSDYIVCNHNTLLVKCDYIYYLEFIYQSSYFFLSKVPSSSSSYSLDSFPGP